MITSTIGEGLVGSGVLAAEEVRGFIERRGDGVAVADCESNEATEDVECSEEAVEVLLAHGSSEVEGGVNEGEVS